MVEIITPGRLKSIKVYETKCKWCGCHFRFQRQEARLEDDRDGTALVIPCPTCRTDIWKAVKL